MKITIWFLNLLRIIAFLLNNLLNYGNCNIEMSMWKLSLIILSQILDGITVPINYALLSHQFIYLNFFLWLIMILYNFVSYYICTIFIFFILSIFIIIGSRE